MKAPELVSKAGVGVDRATGNGSPVSDGPHGPGKATSRDKANLVLPPPETKRWSSRRKAAILVPVRTGVINRHEACQRYLLSEEELAGWEVAFDRAGIRGLRVQSYRRRLCLG